MSILSGIETEVGKIISDISAESRAALASAIEDAKTEVSVLEAKAADIEARIRTLAGAAKKDIEQVIEAAGPGVRTEIGQLIAKLVADLEQALTA